MPHLFLFTEILKRWAVKYLYVKNQIMTVELFDSYGYDSKGGNFICNAVRKGLKYEPETRVSIKRNALYTFLIESGQETNDINQSPLLYEKNEKKQPKHDYSKDYLTFEALENAEFTLTIGSEVSTERLTSISYSLDNGETWVDTNNEDNQTITITTPEVIAGSKVLWKGVGVATTSSSYIQNIASADRVKNVSIFTSTGYYIASGNIMSLLYGDNFEDKDYFESGSSYNFSLLFYAYNILNGNKLIDANKLILPAKICTEGCYHRMFQSQINMSVGPEILAKEAAPYCCYAMFIQCTSLTTAPKLLMTTLSDSCYYAMFQLCASLVKAPKLPVTTLANSCYYGMFMNCTSLIKAPELPATTLSDSCYYAMFSNTSLVEAPKLPATTLAEYCYTRMFQDCTSLVTAPELPATTLSTACYELMFMSCSLLINVPKSLPATTLANTCYHGMFYSCTSLEQGPTVLPGETMKPWCYESMFEECHSLKIAPKIYAKISANRCFNYMFMNCTSLEEGPDIFLSTLSQLSCKNMFTGCSSLKYIKCLATDISAENCTRSWVKGVAANGTFVKNASMSSWTTGDDGIPSGWGVENA